MQRLFARPQLLKFLMNCWPPFWGAGIRIEQLSSDYRFCRITLALRWWNKNANRTQYGGSLFSMTDPVYSMLLMGILGNDYYIWDRGAKITFIKPGKGRVFADIHLSQEQLSAILTATQEGHKHFPVFRINITDEGGALIAEVERTLYVRKKIASQDS